jgi:hypothetical protein
MAKTTATAIEITSRFSFTGTIEKIETFNSKGGGLKLVVQTAESERLLDLYNAKGNVIVFDAGVSKTKANVESSDDDQGELDLSDSIPEPVED